MEKRVYTYKAPATKSKLSTQKIMMILMLGLLSLSAVSVFYHWTYMSAEAGTRVIALIGTAIATAVITEILYYFIFMKLRGKDLRHKIANSFPIITALIIALTVPVWTPFYVLGAGTFVAIFIGKLLFGGFGFNIFNPAIVGRAFIALSFGSQISANTEMGQKFMGQLSEVPTYGLELTTGSTLTTAIADGAKWLPEKLSNIDWTNLLVGFRPGAMGETFGLAIIVIGIFLVLTKIIDWRLPVGMIGTLFVLTLVNGLMNGYGFNEAIQLGGLHILTGGLLFGAVFMITDPVTSPTNVTGKWIYAIFVGALVFLIRVFAALPEGVAFAIAFGNIIVAQLDRSFVRRTHVQLAKRIIPVVATIGLAVGAGAGMTKMKLIEADNLANSNENINVEVPQTFTVFEEYDAIKAIMGDNYNSENDVALTANDATDATVYMHAGTDETIGIIFTYYSGYDGTTSYKKSVFLAVNVANETVTAVAIIGRIASDSSFEGSTKSIINGWVGSDISALDMGSVTTGATYTHDGLERLAGNIKAAFDEVKGGMA